MSCQTSPRNTDEQQGDVLSQGLWPHKSQPLTLASEVDGKLHRAVAAVQHQLRLLPFCGTRPAVLSATSALQTYTETGGTRVRGNGGSSQGGVVPLLDALCNLALVRHNLL